MIDHYNAYNELVKAVVKRRYPPVNFVKNSAAFLSIWGVFLATQDGPTSTEFSYSNVSSPPPQNVWVLHLLLWIILRPIKRMREWESIRYFLYHFRFPMKAVGHIVVTSIYFMGKCCLNCSSPSKISNFRIIFKQVYIIAKTVLMPSSEKKIVCYVVLFPVSRV